MTTPNPTKNNVLDRITNLVDKETFKRRNAKPRQKKTLYSPAGYSATINVSATYNETFGVRSAKLDAARRVYNHYPKSTKDGMKSWDYMTRILERSNGRRATEFSKEVLYLDACQVMNNLGEIYEFSCDIIGGKLLPDGGKLTKGAIRKRLGPELKKKGRYVSAQILHELRIDNHPLPVVTAVATGLLVGTAPGANATNTATNLPVATIVPVGTNNTNAALMSPLASAVPVGTNNNTAAILPAPSNNNTAAILPASGAVPTAITMANIPPVATIAPAGTNSSSTPVILQPPVAVPTGGTNPSATIPPVATNAPVGLNSNTTPAILPAPGAAPGFGGTPGNPVNISAGMLHHGAPAVNNANALASQQMMMTSMASLFASHGIQPSFVINNNCTQNSQTIQSTEQQSSGGATTQEIMARLQELQTKMQTGFQGMENGMENGFQGVNNNIQESARKASRPPLSAEFARVHGSNHAHQAGTVPRTLDFSTGAPPSPARAATIATGTVPSIASVTAAGSPLVARGGSAAESRDPPPLMEADASASLSRINEITNLDADADDTSAAEEVLVPDGQCHYLKTNNERCRKTFRRDVLYCHMHTPE